MFPTRWKELYCRVSYSETRIEISRRIVGKPTIPSSAKGILTFVSIVAVNGKFEKN